MLGTRFAAGMVCGAALLACAGLADECAFVRQENAALKKRLRAAEEVYPQGTYREEFIVAAQACVVPSGDAVREAFFTSISEARHWLESHTMNPQEITCSRAAYEFGLRYPKQMVENGRTVLDSDLFKEVLPAILAAQK